MTDSHGVHVQHNHCDNGHFADNAFLADSEKNKWHITYCGVNAYFQNGIAEKIIKNVHQYAWKQLLHAWSRSYVWLYTHVHFDVLCTSTPLYLSRMMVIWDSSFLLKSDVEQKGHPHRHQFGTEDGFGKHPKKKLRQKHLVELFQKLVDLMPLILVFILCIWSWLFQACFFHSLLSWLELTFMKYLSLQKIQVEF